MKEMYKCCDICFEEYNDNDHRPMKLFCCQKIVCIACLKALGESTSSCPWDRRRWTARMLLKKCEEVTPFDLLEQLNEKIDHDNDEDNKKIVSNLGDGELRQEYEQQKSVIEKRKLDMLEQEKRDAEYARLLSNETLNETFSFSSSSSKENNKNSIQTLFKNISKPLVKKLKPVILKRNNNTILPTPPLSACSRCTFINELQAKSCSLCGNMLDRGGGSSSSSNNNKRMKTMLDFIKIDKRENS